jgi:hypothetical protein
LWQKLILKNQNILILKTLSMNFYYVFTYDLFFNGKLMSVSARRVSDRRMTIDSMIALLENEHGIGYQVSLTSHLNDIDQERYNRLFFPSFDTIPKGDTDILDKISDS